MKKLILITALLLALTSCKKYTLYSVELIRNAEVIYCITENNVMELDMGYSYSSQIEDGIFYLKIDSKDVVALGPKEAVLKGPGRNSKAQIYCSEENYKKLKKFAK